MKREEEYEEEEELGALLPSRAEWGAVRVLLYTPWRRARVLTSLLAQPYTGESAAGARYWEQQATALAAAAGSAAVARSLAAHCPHSLYLNIVGASAALWAQAEGACGAGGAARRGAGGARGAAVLAQLLPALVRALHSEWARKESECLARAVRRALGREAGCGWVGAALRLEAEGHAARPRLPHALYAALHHAPHHKWMYVRGAVWCGGEATSLADTLLDKLLRLHALPHELQPLLDAHHDRQKKHTRSEHGEGSTEHGEGSTEHGEGSTEHEEIVPNEEKIENYAFNEPLDVFMDPQDIPLAERRGYGELRDVNDASDGSTRGA
ncbi:PREDICTED: uncharacterized protein LOC106105806 [Papilio polytes]|uniref:uncharacterized protein LOC106105806 n=1 Tax=Papilio polytes TaxID=76194 RepID=UPI00067661DC|nr:PREDICTED: uncharacterized protein LOC106105806 [Papilio polytes]